MQPTSEMILEQALQLSENERLMLVSRLLASMPAEDSSTSLDDPSFIDELDRRFADPEGSVAWSDLRAEKECRPPT